jgi:heme-degrading monooxygenase HmoA
MKSKSKPGWLLLIAFIISMLSIAQVRTDHLVQSKIETNMKDRKETHEIGEVHPNEKTNVALIDKLSIPAASIDEFLHQTKIIGEFLRTLPGFISQQAFASKDSEGNMTLITVAIWEDQDALGKAKNAVQTEFERLNLHPQELFKRLNVKMERSVYRILDN